VYPPQWAPSKAEGTQVRTERLLIRAVLCLRATQLAVVLPVLAIGELEGFLAAGHASVGYLIAVTWSAVLYAVALRRDTVTPPWVLGDVALAACWLVTVPRMCDGACASGPDWVVPFAMGTGVLAAVFSSAGVAFHGLLVLGGTYLVGIWPQLDRAPDALSSIAVTCFLVLGFAVLARLIATWLRASARTTDTATAEAIEARAREAAAQARIDERFRQYDGLHQTVLSTLTTIARGGLDHRAAEVRELCARDADFLRGLVTGTAGGGSGDFAADLAGVVRDKQTLGLRVNSRFHDLPAELPPRVAPALLGAAREALNNVVRHSGTDEAWLSVVGEGDGVRITVVDRGVGFDPSTAAVGHGLVRELRDAVTDAGGTAAISSNPGEGTVVEVLWKP
jgi:signal transduction histidine kinase